MVEKLQDSQLVESTKQYVQKERECTMIVLDHLREIEKRKVHLKRGYSSLHEFTVKELGYSDGAAFRRISSMRLTQSVPGAREKIDSGELTLTNASKLQNFLRIAKKKRISVPAPSELLVSVSNCSSRECDRELSKVHLELVIKENSKVISPSKVKLEFSFDQEMLAKLKIAMGHKVKLGTLEELFTLLAEEKIGNKEKVNSKRKAPTKTRARSRYIPVEIRRLIQGSDQCNYIDPVSGRRCSARRFLEIDHRVPFAKGGSHHPDNLRILCSSHNKLRNQASPQKQLGAVLFDRWMPLKRQGQFK